MNQACKVTATAEIDYLKTDKKLLKKIRAIYQTKADSDTITFLKSLIACAQSEDFHELHFLRSKIRKNVLEEISAHYPIPQCREERKEYEQRVETAMNIDLYTLCLIADRYRKLSNALHDTLKLELAYDNSMCSPKQRGSESSYYHLAASPPLLHYRRLSSALHDTLNREYAFKNSLHPPQRYGQVSSFYRLAVGFPFFEGHVSDRIRKALKRSIVKSTHSPTCVRIATTETMNCLIH